MRAVDLFAGCGGLSLGLLKSGIDVVAAFDSWKPAVLTYRENFSHPIIQQDLSELDKTIDIVRRYHPDLIAGGPPCQDFSHSGYREERSRAELTTGFAHIVAEIRPPSFVMENVDRAQASQAYSVARSVLKNAGYGLSEHILDASYCGVPQKRKRFFCVGSLEAKDGFLGEIIKSKTTENPMSVRDYFGTDLEFDFYYRHPRSYTRKAIFSVDEPAPTMRGTNRPIPKGYPGNHNDAAPITADLHALTMMDRARIQTFPKQFKWVGSKTNIEQMIGNAVPVEMGRFIGECIIQFSKK